LHSTEPSNDAGEAKAKEGKKKDGHEAWKAKLAVLNHQKNESQSKACILAAMVTFLCFSSEEP
jgi:hypothetical protein